MKYFRRLTTTFAVLGFFHLVFAKKAHAYLDLGTASFMLQLMIAGFLGWLFVVKRFQNKIKMFFNNLFSKEGKHDGSSD